MTYAQWRAAADQATNLWSQAAAAQAAAQAALPFLGDDVFVHIGAFLDVRMLGRLACTAPRFSRKTVADPEHEKGEGRPPPQMWTVAEEGARRGLERLARERGWVVRRDREDCWLEVLRKAYRPLRFTRVSGALRCTRSDDGAVGFPSEILNGAPYLGPGLGPGQAGLAGRAGWPAQQPGWLAARL